MISSQLINEIRGFGMPQPFKSRLKSDVAPVLLLNQIFGLFPYDLDTLQLRYWSLLLTISLPSSISTSLYIALSGGNKQNYDSLVWAIFRTATIVPWVTTSYMFWKTLFVRSDIATIVTHISMVENRFRFKKRHPSTFKSSFIYDFAFRAVMTSCASYAAYRYVKGALYLFLIRLFGLYLTLFLQSLYDLQFLVFVKQMEFWFRLIRKRLTVSAVDQLIDCHKDLSVACRVLQRAYSYQNFLSLSNCFLLILIDFYILFVSRTGSLLDPVSVQVLFRMGLRMYQVLFMVVHVEQLCSQIRAFDNALLTILLADHTKTLARDAKVKAHLSRKNIVKFTAGDLFIIDSTLLHSITAVTVNYLIILIQFGGSDHKI